jgi:4-cresol dehydrogenase (hydroxylating)
VSLAAETAAGRLSGAALTALRQALGAVAVEVLPLAAPSAFEARSRAAAVLRPASATQVQAALRVAGRHGLRLHPVSRGRNWGFGFDAEALAGTVVLDLSRMSQIEGGDLELGLLTVQPGVTFAQVHAHLDRTASRFFLPAIGGPPDASVLANALQRGHGIGPRPRRTAAIESLTAVLADGSQVRVGRHELAGSRRRVNTSGPDLIGLFIQSDLAVVTAMTLRLELRPQRLQLFQAGPFGVDELAEIVEATRDLLIGLALGPCAFTVWNAYKAATLTGRYPWAAMGGATPLDLTALGIAAGWQVSGALYGTSEAQVAAARTALAAAVPGVVFPESADPAVLNAAGAYLGEPTERNLASLGWRRPARAAPAGRDPQDGLLWLCPVVPHRGAAVAETVSTLEHDLLAAGFEPSIGFNLDDGRDIEMFVALHYDPQRPDEAERALRAHEDLLSPLAALGAPPARLGFHTPPSAAGFDSGTALLIEDIRGCVDPGGLFLRGPYSPPAAAWLKVPAPLGTGQRKRLRRADP